MSSLRNTSMTTVLKRLSLDQAVFSEEVEEGSILKNGRGLECAKFKDIMLIIAMAFISKSRMLFYLIYINI